MLKRYSLGGILFGYDTGVISGVKEMKDWLRTFGHPDPSTATGYAISSSTESLVVSILSAGTFFGALLAAPTAGMFFAISHGHYANSLRADLIGRKWVSHCAMRRRKYRTDDSLGYRLCLLGLLCWRGDANSRNRNPPLRQYLPLHAPGTWLTI